MRVLTEADDEITIVTRTLPRQARMFTTETRVEFSHDATHDRTVMELVAADRPGLLSNVGQVFIALGIDIEAAKIMTIGERAEDVFYITDESGVPLSEDAQLDLRERIVQKLDNTSTKQATGQK